MNIRHANVDPALSRSRYALMAAYGANGLLLSTWFSRLPAMADRLGIAADHLGVVMFALTASSLVAIPIAGRNLTRWRATRIARITTPLNAAAMLVAIAATSVGQLTVALLAMGAINGVNGVGLNAHGTDLSRRAGRAWMPGMLGAASTGGVIGAAIGSLASTANASVSWHLGLVGLACMLTTLAVSRQITVGGGTSSLRIANATARRAAQRWEHHRHQPATAHVQHVRCTMARQRRNVHGRVQSRRLEPQRRAPLDRYMRLLIGAGLGATIAEGALANFGIIVFRDVLGAEIGTAALAFTLFSIVMAVIRLGGGIITSRFGAFRTMLVGGALASLGGAALLLRPGLPVAFVALSVTAAGIACAVPVVLQLGATHAREAAAHRGVNEDRAAARALSRLGLATAGGFLTGGPIVGLLASAIGLRPAVTIVALGGLAMLLCTVLLGRGEPRTRARQEPAYASRRRRATSARVTAAATEAFSDSA